MKNMDKCSFNIILGCNGYGIRIGYGSITIEIQTYENGDVKYEIFRYYVHHDGFKIKSEKTTIKLEDTFDCNIFRDEIEQTYFDADEEIDSDVLNVIVKSLTDCVEKTRRIYSSCAIVWVGKQLCREWKDLLPYTITNFM